MDDIIITSNDASGIEDIKQKLGTIFEVKDLASSVLGIEIARSRHGISMFEKIYVLDLLRNTDMMVCRPASTPMDPNHKISSELGELLFDPSF